jgi:hypothetical protein
VLRRAVRGMLPKNNLLPDRMRKLRVFAGPDHPYGAALRAEPFEMPPRTLRDSRTGWVLPQGFAAMNPGAYARRLRGSRWAAPGVERPAVAFDDLLSLEERALVAASSGGGAGGGAAGE